MTDWLNVSGLNNSVSVRVENAVSRNTAFHYIVFDTFALKGILVPVQIPLFLSCQQFQ